MVLLHQAPLLEGNDTIASTDDKLLALMRRLGIEALPHHETLLIPSERIVVPGADVLRPSPRLVKSIKQVGILQAPAVELTMGVNLHAPDATWQVIFGRRRVLAARLAGLPAVKCEAYEPGTPQLASLLALIENDQRSTAWIKEVQDLRRLIDERVGMTTDDLASFGFDRGAINERLKIAQLPLPILTVIYAGRINELTAKKIARLTPSQQEKLADLVLGGEELTAELVKSALRRQINTGFVPLQDALAASMAATSSPEPSVPNGTFSPSVSASQPVPAPGSTSAQVPPTVPGLSIAQVLTTLKTFERQLRSTPATQPIRLLTTSLIQQLEMAERDKVPLVQPNHFEAQKEVRHD